MWGGSGTDPLGHTGVVADVNVDSEGNGNITFYDENGELSGGKSKGTGPIHVSSWSMAVPWQPEYHYTQFNWTVQGQAPPAAAPSFLPPGAINRYYNPQTGDHWVTSGGDAGNRLWV